MSGLLHVPAAWRPGPAWEHHRQCPYPEHNNDRWESGVREWQSGSFIMVIHCRACTRQRNNIDPILSSNSYIASCELLEVVKRKNVQSKVKILSFFYLDVECTFQYIWNVSWITFKFIDWNWCHQKHYYYYSQPLIICHGCEYMWNLINNLNFFCDNNC